MDLCWGRWDTDEYRLVILIDQQFFSRPVLFYMNRLVDLGDENITEQLSNQDEQEVTQINTIGNLVRMS
jgi:hypothetical protein